MRRHAVLLAALAAAVPAAPAAAQTTNPPAIGLHAVTSPPPEHRADPSLKTYVFRFGTYRIGRYQAQRRTDFVHAPPEAGSIVGMDVRILDESGNVIPQYEVMLHHMLFTNGGADDRLKDNACPGRPVQQKFFGTSEELRPLTLPRGYGYPTQPTDKWRSIWMLMNHQPRIRAATIEYRVTVDPSPDIVPVKPYWLSVLPCSSARDPQYSVPGGGPRGSTHKKSRTWTLPEDGRIVAVGGHLHGGSNGLDLSRDSCRQTIFSSKPTYGTQSDPLYAVTPLLHEPDPKSMTWYQSGQGWPVRRGDRLRVTARYDGERPHMRVMGIAHVYLAPPTGPADPCAGRPPDSEVLADLDGRANPPLVKLTLASLGPDGIARPIRRPSGRLKVLRRGAEITVRRSRFSLTNLSIPAGERLRWRFRDRVAHDATLADGPRGFATPTVRRGRFSQRLDKPGEYRLYCSIHPVVMSQYVKVRRRR